MIQDVHILLNKLNEHVCHVRFTKKDGTVREMRCTLREDILPKQTDLEEHTQRKQPTESVAVWDLDANGWRSFRYDSIIEFSVGTP